MKSKSEFDLQFPGVNLWDDHLRVIASALLLYKDDLTKQLNLITSDYLMPTEASFPIEFELNGLNKDFDDFYIDYGLSEFLERLRPRRELKSGLAYPRNSDISELISEGEGQTIEFKRQYPNKSDDLAKEIAAFGTTNPGVILLGVANNGEVVGIDDIDTAEGLDRLKLRVEGITSNVIIPSLTVRIRSEEVDQKYIAILEVPNGPEPVYYTKNGVPYIRHGSLSRPANPMEVYALIKRHIEKE